ncbi:DUF2141 domain-containing protein [Bizionia gelidisalsuginis]|uniref:DUF2141 domain-containing protein n=1 Tax=Bizionia gelidisalsuginis TaxID=291188 RepID=A0ABY3ME22_9FLAO|nr:DUF2141 domain-containing protein [Bizionia gelidisalsuginis]TYC17830.1 DUF2141 domain-containing protein [Bizionia gelidisalsuginis]
MKSIVLFIICLSLSISGWAQSDNTNTITITINNIKNDTGKILLGLHTENTFMKTEALQRSAVEIIEGKIKVTFNNVTAGEYAILALHDENNNGKMDFTPNGMPKEDYGLSNNAMSFGPPQFSDAKFEVTTEDITLNILL